MCGRLIGIACALLLAGMPNASAQVDHTVNWRAKAEKVEPFIGSMNYAPIFNDPDIARELDAILGKNKAHFMENIQVAVPIFFDGVGLLLRGGRPHENHRESAILLLTTNPRGPIYAGIHSDGQRTIYTRAATWDELPRSIKEWVYRDWIEDLLDAPPRFSFTLNNWTAR